MTLNRERQNLAQSFLASRQNKGFHIGDARTKNSDAAQPCVTNVKTPNVDAASSVWKLQIFWKSEESEARLYRTYILVLF